MVTMTRMSMRCANRPMSGERKTGKIPMGARESPAHMEV